MARYRRIDPHIWHDDKFPSLSDDAKLLFFHLITTPRGNPLGCFVQGKTDMAEYLNWSMRRLSTAFSVLISVERVKYDDGKRLVLLPNYLKYNPLENENQAKMALKYLVELPYNSQFFQYLKLFLEQYGKPFLEPLITGIDRRNSIGNGIGNSIGNGMPITEPYSLALNLTPEPNTPPTPKGDEDVLMSFEEFWDLYPRKKSKGQAEKAWKALNPSVAIQEHISETLFKASRSQSWLKESGRFIPHPATWLRARGWEDEVDQ